MKTYYILLALVIVVPIYSKKAKDGEKPKWAQKGENI